MTRAFISYSHADDKLRAEFEKHLSLLRREGLLDIWTDHPTPGMSNEMNVSMPSRQFPIPIVDTPETLETRARRASQSAGIS